MQNALSNNQNIQNIVEIMYNKYYLIMIRYALNYVSLTDAEDIVSKCWLSLTRNMLQLSKKESKIQTCYIMKTLHHEIVDFYRKNAAKRKLQEKINLSEELKTLSFSLEEETVNRILLMELQIYLTPKEKLVVRCRLNHVDDVKVASALGVTAVNIRVTWHRALVKMKSNFQR